MWVWSLGWEDPWRREWLPTPVFLSGEFHGQRNLPAYSSLQMVTAAMKLKDAYSLEGKL